MPRSSVLTSRVPRSRRYSDRYHQQGNLAGRMGTEERDGVVVVKGQTGGAMLQRVGGEIGPAAVESGFELSRAVAAIAHRVEQAIEIRHVTDQRGTFRAQRLLQAQVAGVAAEVSSL